MESGRVVDALVLGPHRRRRRMTKALRQLDFADAPPPASRQHVPPPRRSGRQLVAVAVVVTCFAAPVLVPRLLPARAADVGEPVPPPGAGERHHRLLPPVVAPAGVGGYVYELTQPHSQRPVTYDSCRPLRYVVGLEHAPPGARQVVDEAAARVSAATGLVLVDEGLTDEVPSRERAAYQPDRYGEQWAPVLIAWSDPVETPGLAGRVAGIGGSRPWSDTHGRLTYVTGTVTLDTPTLAPLLSTRAGRAEVRAVVMHELGHVVGLAHTKDRHQLMYADNTGRTAFGDGDLRGLAMLGVGPCRPDL
ncbi:matrixin family metalloprotease [Motilibacter rhizosphaerae]|uniref:matrixin family metalloprotease n=1 Tax=Motilibacter rhizosphaerae TaxID=598652 RepID=UPI00102C6631|nr:matrixin family metalloprotease [Motilibacter rhizosphaerae]